MIYEFLEQYGWLLVLVLGALLVCLMFVQGANSLVGSLGGDAEGRRLVIQLTARKWKYTFITFVLFGVALYFSFPQFYNPSVGGAFWLWMVAVCSFVLQTLCYIIQNALDSKTFRFFLVLNGYVGPLSLGSLLATFFEDDSLWVLVLGLAVFFLARIMGILYIMKEVDDADIHARARLRLTGSTIAFLVFFVAYFVHLLLKEGVAG